MKPSEIEQARRLAQEALERRVICDVCDALGGCRPDVPALAALVERMAGELARLPGADVLAEMRARTEQALDVGGITEMQTMRTAAETIRILAEDLSDLLDTIAPPPTKIT